MAPSTYDSLFHTLHVYSQIVNRIESRAATDHLPDDILLLQLLQEGNFPDGCARDALLFLLQSDLLQRNGLPIDSVASLIDDAVCALPYLLHLLILHQTHQALITDCKSSGWMPNTILITADSFKISTAYPLQQHDLGEFLRPCPQS